MRFGAHLPIAAFSGSPLGGNAFAEYAETAEELGFTTLCANDHLVFSVPWVDALVALGLAAGRTSRIRLMTTAALLAVRGAASLGSALAALQHLSEGRLVAAVTPGSSRSDYEAVERNFASWGSQAGLRRVARSGDGWLASAYHGTPDHIAESFAYLTSRLEAAGREPASFPMALATTYLYVTEDPEAAQSALGLAVSPAAAPSDLRDRLLIGTPAECAARLRRLEAAGVVTDHPKPALP